MVLFVITQEADKLARKDTQTYWQGDLKGEMKTNMTYGLYRLSARKGSTRDIGRLCRMEQAAGAAWGLCEEPKKLTIPELLPGNSDRASRPGPREEGP